jgi:hypothetical protein
MHDAYVESAVAVDKDTKERQHSQAGLRFRFRHRRKVRKGTGKEPGMSKSDLHRSEMDRKL